MTKRTTEANFVTYVKHVTRTPRGDRKRGVRAYLDENGTITAEFTGPVTKDANGDVTWKLTGEERLSLATQMLALALDLQQRMR